MDAGAGVLSVVKGTRGPFLISPDGSGTATGLTAKEGGLPNAWTPDGSVLLAIFFPLGRQTELVSRDGKTAPRPLAVSSVANIAQFDFSPDGRWLAYGSQAEMNAPGHVYVQSYLIARPPSAGLERERGRAGMAAGRAGALLRGGRVGRWPAQDSDDGGPDYDDPDVFGWCLAGVIRGTLKDHGPFRGYDVTPDGQRFLMVREIAQPPARLSQIVLVQNWTEELKRVVPAK